MFTETENKKISRQTVFLSVPFRTKNFFLPIYSATQNFKKFHITKSLLQKFNCKDFVLERKYVSLLLKAKKKYLPAMF